MTGWKQVLREAVAAVLGYAVIVALTTLGLEVWMAGADVWGGGWAIQLQAAFVGIASGLAGGAAAAITGGRPLRDAALVLVFLAIDTTYVAFVLDSGAPAWFDIVAGLVLMAATLAGGMLVELARRRRRASSTP